MNKQRMTKIFALVTALSSAAVAALGHDYVTAVGIVAAALSSLSAIKE